MADDETQPNDQQGASGESESDKAAPEGSGGSEGGTLTQEQVNAIVQDRLERERKQFRQQLQEMGFEDLEEVRELKEQRKEEREEELKEQEKYKELLEQREQEFQEELSEKEQRLQELEQERQRERKVTELMAAGQKHGAVDAEQVAKLLRDRVDVEDGDVVVVDDDGEPILAEDGSYKGADTLVEDFLEENPHFKRAASGEGAGGGPAGGDAPEQGNVDLERAANDQDYYREHRDEIRRKVQNGEVDV
ncbi:MAG: hypothetical protein ABEN55_15550 [Bradymonadaceae bacterium]